MRRFRLIVLLFASLATGQAAGQDLRGLRIGAGPADSTEFQVAGLIGSVISNPPGSSGCSDAGACGLPGLIVTVLRTPSGAATVEGILDGSLEGGLVGGDLLWRATSGIGEFARKPVNKLRHVATLYSETLLVLVKRDGPVKTVADLRNRKIAIVDSEGFERDPIRAILASANITERQLRIEALPQQRALAKLSLGEVDAVFLFTTEPQAVLARAQPPVPIVALGLTDAAVLAITRNNPYFVATKLAPATATSPHAGVNVLTVPVQWVVGANLPDDTVGASVSALLHPRNRAVLAGGNPAIAKFQPSQALFGAVLPLHPAAEKFYRISGVIR